MLWQWRRCDAVRLCWSGTRGPHSCCCSAAAAVDMSCAAVAAGQRPPFESQPAKRARTDLRSWTVSCRRRPDRYTRRPNSQTTYYSENQAFCFEPELRIHDILGWIRIRGSMPLTNGSGSGSDPDPGSCYFRHWPSRCQQKTNFLTQFFCLLLFEATFTSFFKDKMSKRVTK